MKLELKHLAAYLPYGLMILNCVNKDVYECYGAFEAGQGLMVIIDKDLNTRTFGLSDIKPILRPMSDIINPVLSKGLYREPMRYLKHGGTDLDELRTSSDWSGAIEYSCCDNEGHETRYNVEEMSFTQRYNGETRYYNNQYESMCKLFENHFDVFGLIKKGLAIDINTLQS